MQYGQMYFLVYEDAVNKKLEHPLNPEIRRNLMELLEHVIQSQNNFSQSLVMIQEVEEEVKW